MTSIYSADNPYYLLGPCVATPYAYEKGSVMDYIYNRCPAFALCAQKAGQDKWLQEATCTIFAPSQYYSTKYFDHFKTIDFYTANTLILNSTICAKIGIQDFSNDSIPNRAGNYLQVCSEGDDVFINGQKIKYSVECSNGVIHLLDGMLSADNGYIS